MQTAHTFIKLLKPLTWGVHPKPHREAVLFYKGPAAKVAGRRKEIKVNRDRAVALNEGRGDSDLLTTLGSVVPYGVEKHLNTTTHRATPKTKMIRLQMSTRSRLSKPLWADDAPEGPLTLTNHVASSGLWKSSNSVLATLTLPPPKSQWERNRQLGRTRWPALGTWETKEGRSPGHSLPRQVVPRDLSEPQGLASSPAPESRPSAVAAREPRKAVSM